MEFIKILFIILAFYFSCIILLLILFNVNFYKVFIKPLKQILPISMQNTSVKQMTTISVIDNEPVSDNEPTLTKIQILEDLDKETLIKLIINIRTQNFNNRK